MSKAKAPKTKGVPNKHLHARTTFLYQAASYLTLRSMTAGPTALHAEHQTPDHSSVALQLGSDLQQVSRKAQLRLSVDMKRSMCKSCNAVLVPGTSATQTIANHSKNGKKPWADVLELVCHFCGKKKRFPVGVNRQLRKSKRALGTTEVDLLSLSEDAHHSDSTLLTGTGDASHAG